MLLAGSVQRACKGTTLWLSSFICKTVSCTVVSDYFATPWTVACSLLCSWVSPAKNTGVGCYSLLQGIFPTQGSGVDSGSPTLQTYSLPSEPPGKPLIFNRGLIIAPSQNYNDSQIFFLPNSCNNFYHNKSLKTMKGVALN